MCNVLRLKKLLIYKNFDRHPGSSVIVPLICNPHVSMELNEFGEIGRFYLLSIACDVRAMNTSVCPLRSRSPRLSHSVELLHFFYHL